ncbi:MAG: hypothetical protein CM1200mP24_01360 [Gammaproteobacteria bacterium]|nr:MAG: hypothetical protein CM1200mP24_01360 [Gammaproteobacteria bacterium]
MERVPNQEQIKELVGNGAPIGFPITTRAQTHGTEQRLLTRTREINDRWLAILCIRKVGKRS